MHGIIIFPYYFMAIPIVLLFSSIILACFEYLPIFGQSALLCSHRNALVAANRPTNFCQAQGW